MTLPYPRSIDVAGAPTADRLLVNDNQESNLTFSIVIDPASDGYSKIDIGDLVAEQTPVRALFRKYGHLYLSGDRWIDDHRLLVHIVAFDALSAAIPRSIDRFVVVRV